MPEDQLSRLRERANANHQSLKGKLRALIDEATGTQRQPTIDEIVAGVSRLGPVQRDDAAALIREHPDR